MIFGKKTVENFDIEVNGEKLDRKKEFKYLGLRFNDQLSVDPQIRYLVNTRFLKHRGLINAVMYSKNRLNLFNLFQSLYYGQLQFSIETWPRLTPAQGNKLCREMIKPIIDIYGLKQYLGPNKRYDYMELLTRVGTQSPINVQDRAIFCFANGILKAQNPQELLYHTLLQQFCMKFQGREYHLRYFNNYHRAVLTSTGIAKIVFKRVPYKCFPGNMNDSFWKLPNDLKAHFDTRHFKTICKTHFKYKCPHGQHKHPHDCKACIEMISAKDQIKGCCKKIWLKNQGFSLNYVYSENYCDDSERAAVKVSLELIAAALDMVPLYES